ncbi:MAG: glutathione S-transferase family protein [Bdellovibrionales bacterium]|nr:glutathione S-transferase family protein [Bdellovibrionales bacterium]
MIEIYGSPRSSAGRCYWMLEELGVAYKSMPLDMRAKEHKSPEFLKLNPNGKVPCLKEDDFVIWESMAINSYLADKHQSPLMGESAEERGLIAQWSYWSQLELQKPLIDIFIQKVFVPEERRDMAVIEKAQKAAPQLFLILDQALANNKYIAGDRFTVADINVASVVAIADEVKMDISNYKNIQAWLSSCKDRPAYQKYESLKK